MAIILANTYTTEYGFIYEEFAETVCQGFEIKSQNLIKPKQIQKSDGRAAKLITHAIYLIPTIGTYTENLTPLLITKLRNHLMIFGQL